MPIPTAMRSSIQGWNRETRNFPGVFDDRYIVRIAANAHEVESAFRLRYKVFNIELGNRPQVPGSAPLEFDSYDLKCKHLIVVSRSTGKTVGTYRLNSIETAGSVSGFYSSNEFTIEDLPEHVLTHGIEIGRACIAEEHRNTKVLFLLWKALLAYLEHSGKQYFFGCCSVFTQDVEVGRQTYWQLVGGGYLHESYCVMPCQNGLSLIGDDTDRKRIELPGLFNMYLRIGARVCGPPMIDREFGTIDFFVIFDLAELGAKYHRMFSQR